MAYLILSILSSVGILIIFKIADIKKIELYSIILINYLTASAFGFLYDDSNISILEIIGAPWLFIAFVIGIMFITIFFLLGYSTQKAGIAITSLSAKISLVIPFVFSIIYDPADKLTTSNLLGISLALIALGLSVWKKKTSNIESKYIILPVILFLGLGLVDSFVKFAQQDYIDKANLSIFNALIFMFAAVTAILAGFAIKFDFKKLNKKEAWIYGILLGLFNFGSMYFFILTLEDGFLMSSSVFGINNMGIVLVSVIIGLFFFKEKLQMINKIGIALALVAIWLLVQ